MKYQISKRFHDGYEIECCEFDTIEQAKAKRAAIIEQEQELAIGDPNTEYVIRDTETGKLV